jgi:hypothetical protein
LKMELYIYRVKKMELYIYRVENKKGWKKVEKKLKLD